MNAFFKVIGLDRWDGPYPASVQEEAIQALETGKVLILPNLSFPLHAGEIEFLSPQTVQGSKNVSYNPVTGQVKGTGLAGIRLDELRGLVDRFARASRQLLEQLFPTYRAGMRQGRTSLRPVEIAGRPSSWRKDDTRLHVDSFPSMPTRGQRILRVFSNINQEGRPRVWRVGGPFEAVARRFRSTLRAPVWGSTLLLYVLRMTRTVRSPYDHFMLQLHDRMKEDQDYQARGDQVTHPFPAGSTWIAYTDQVPHAAVSGIHQLEQTFYIPVTSLRVEGTAPLRVLEALTGRKLA